MARRFIEFELTFTALDQDRYSVRVRTPDGAEGSSTFQIPPDGTPIAGTDKPFGAALAELQAEYPDTDEALLSGLGELLFGLVFQGAAASAYDRAQGANNSDPDTLLRLKLNIAETDARLAQLPWELLKAPQDVAALVLTDASVVRYLPLLTPTPSVQASLPLRVLLTGAATPPMPDVARELAAVRASLKPLEDRGLVTVTVEEHLTPNKLQRLLAPAQGFHVWHFVGHGVTTDDKSGRALRFEDESGDPKTVTASQLNVLLGRTSVRLILLSSCNSASVTAISPTRGVAPALVKARVPAVVAMQFTAPESATRVFAAEFYRALAEGESVDSCVTEGRKAVYFENGVDLPDWALPVVYTRAPDGRLFDLPQPDNQPAVNSQQPNNQQPNNQQPLPSGPQPSQLAAIAGAQEEIAALALQNETNRRTQRQLQLQLAQLGDAYAPPTVRTQLDAFDKSLPQDYVRLAEAYGRLVQLSERAGLPEAAERRRDWVGAQITAKELERDVCQRRAGRLGAQFGRKDLERAQELSAEIAALRAQQ